MKALFYSLCWLTIFITALVKSPPLYYWSHLLFKVHFPYVICIFHFLKLESGEVRVITNRADQNSCRCYAFKKLNHILLISCNKSSAYFFLTTCQCTAGTANRLSQEISGKGPSIFPRAWQTSLFVDTHARLLTEVKAYILEQRTYDRGILVILGSQHPFSFDFLFHVNLISVKCKGQ